MTEAWIFTCLGLMILPGPDMALVTKQTLGYGWRGGLGTLLGIYLAFALYSLAIMLGIIPLLNSWPAFFLLARILGGIYLIYLGLQGIRAATENKEMKVRKDVSSYGFVRSGFISNALNAKQYLFLFLLLPSFLPQDPSWIDSVYLLLVLLLVSLLFWAVWIVAIDFLGEKMKYHHQKIEVLSSLALIVVGGLLLVGII